MSAAAEIQAGGTLIPERHVYIARPEDDRLFELLIAGEYCNVLTSRQMGKSSLMVATAVKLRERGVKVAMLDVAGEIGSEPDQQAAWRTIIDKIASDLDLDRFDPDAWWNEQPEGTNNRKLLRFFRDVVGREIPERVVVFFDEIDATLRVPYADDLFTALRTMYNERATDEAFARLTFCVIGVATPNELVKNARTTAYNIGTNVPLRDFEEGRDDLTPLLRALSADDSEAWPLLRRILEWTGGHPYLTLKLCRELAGRMPRDVDAYAERTFAGLDELRGDTHFQQILRFFNERVTEGAVAFAILEKIIRGESVIDRATLAHAQLKLSGLVKADGRGRLIMRNKIYARVFDLHWLQTLDPKRRAIWLQRYAVTASVIMALAFLAYAYYRVVRLPQTIARDYENRLQMTTSFDELKLFGLILSGRKPDPTTGIVLRGGTDANAALHSASERLNAQYQTAALQKLADGEIEEGLALAAYTAEHTKAPLDPRFRKEYDSRGYGALVKTLRSTASFDPGLAVSSDGKQIAVGNIVWRDDGGWSSWRIGAGAGVNAVAFGPDGVYTGDDTGAVKVWVRQASKPAESRTLATLPDRVIDLAVSPDGRVAVVMRDSTGVEIIDGDGRHVLTLATSRPPAAVAFSPDGRTLATISGPELALWSADGRMLGRNVWSASSTLRDVALSDDLAAVAEVRDVRIARGRSRLKQVDRVEHVPPVRSLAFHGTKLATASDGGVRLFDIAETATDSGLPFGEPVEANLRGSDALAVAFAEGTNLLVVKRTDSVQIWRLDRTEEEIAAGDRAAAWEKKFAVGVHGGEVRRVLLTVQP